MHHIPVFLTAHIAEFKIYILYIYISVMVFSNQNIVQLKYDSKTD